MKSLYLGLVLLLILLSGCSFFGSSEEKANVIEYEKKISELEDKLNTTLEYGKPKVEDLGDFIVEYQPTENLNFKDIKNSIEDKNNFNLVLRDINDFISLPKNISIIFTECSEENAFYLPENNSILICYELMHTFKKRLIYHAYDDKELLDRFVIGATYFTLYHEIGHALIHVLELPITGKEEDVADQLATFLLTLEESKELSPLIAASFFADENLRKKSEALPYWDTHSIDASRYYNILCWVYGKNTTKYEPLVKEDFLPMERSLNCEYEYAKIWNSWGRLLWPYLKDECNGCEFNEVCYLNEVARIENSELLYCQNKEWVKRKIECSNCIYDDDTILGIFEENLTKFTSGGLKIEEIGIWLDRSFYFNAKDTPKIENITAGSYLKLELVLRNNLRVKISNVTVEFTIETTNNEIETRESLNLDIKPLERRSIVFEYHLPSKLKKGIYYSKIAVKNTLSKEIRFMIPMMINEIS